MDNKCLWDIIDRLRDEVNIASDGIVDLNDVVRDLQAESIEQIKDNKRLQDKLQEVNNDYNNDHKVHNDYADGLLAEIKELKAENEELKHELKHKAIKIHQDRIPKEYQAEASEYFHHNPHCKKLLFFMIEGNEFDNDGCYDACLLDDDCIAEVENS